MTLRHPDAIGAATCAAVGIAVIAGALTIRDPGFGVVSPATMPLIIGVLILASAAWLAWDTVRARTRPVLEELDRQPLVMSVLAAAAFLAAFVPVGFVLTAVPYLVIQARVLGSRSLIRDAIASLAFVLGIYFLFVGFLTVDLPKGPLPF